MLKSACLIVIRMVAVLLILFPVFWSPVWADNTAPSDTVNHSASAVENSQPLNGENPQVKASHCHQKNVEGKTMMNQNCQKAPKVLSTQVTYPQPPHPYDMEAIERFDQELYGE